MIIPRVTPGHALPRFLLPLLLLLAVSAWAEETPSNEDCLTCHEDSTLTREDGSSVAVDAKVFGQSLHGEAGLACVDCHTALASTTDFPHEEHLPPPDCSGCHPDEVAAYNLGIHAEARREHKGSPAATCADCHGAHDIRSSTDPESRTYHLNLPHTCGRCHGNPKTIREGGIRIGNVVKKFEDSIHGRALEQSGLLVAPNCATCHGHHDIRPAKDPKSHVARANIPGTCGSCHEGIETRYFTGIHGQALKQGNPRAAVCSDCHTAHSIESTRLAPWKLEVISECGTCHEESIHTYRDTFHGKVTALGFTRVAGCADCHGAHTILPPSDPRSNVAPQNLVKTCGRCHSQANANFVRYDPHASPKDPERDPSLYYAARFMRLLLMAVFGFFGIHTALWLPRSYRARRERRRAQEGRETASETESSDGDESGDA